MVDHESTDRTQTLIAEAAAQDPRIVHLSCHGSFVEAANLAWTRGCAPFSARMDADDYAHPLRLEKQLAFLKENPDRAACGTLVDIRKRGEKEALPADDGYRRYETWVNSVVDPETILTQRFIDSPIPNPTMMIRRPVMESLGGYRDPTWAEDYDFWLRFFGAGHRAAKVPEHLLTWYDCPHRSTRTIPRYEIEQFQRAKAHYLARLDCIRSKGVAIWGAGPTGKQMAQLLETENIDAHRFIEVSEKKIGHRAAGKPVVDYRDLETTARDSPLIVAVGVPSARAEIQAHLSALGLREGTDFFCVA